MHYNFLLILLFLICVELHKIVFHPFDALFLLMYICKSDLSTSLEKEDHILEVIFEDIRISYRNYLEEVINNNYMQVSKCLSCAKYFPKPVVTFIKQFSTHHRHFIIKTALVLKYLAHKVFPSLLPKGVGFALFKLI